MSDNYNNACTYEIVDNSDYTAATATKKSPGCINNRGRLYVDFKFPAVENRAYSLLRFKYAANFPLNVNLYFYTGVGVDGVSSLTDSEIVDSPPRNTAEWHVVTMDKLHKVENPYDARTMYTNQIRVYFTATGNTALPDSLKIWLKDVEFVKSESNRAPPCRERKIPDSELEEKVIKYLQNSEGAEDVDYDHTPDNSIRTVPKFIQELRAGTAVEKFYECINDPPSSILANLTDKFIKPPPFIIFTKPPEEMDRIFTTYIPTPKETESARRGFQIAATPGEDRNLSFGIRTADAPLKEIYISVGDLEGPNRAKLSSNSMQIRKVRYLFQWARRYTISGEKIEGYSLHPQMLEPLGAPDKEAIESSFTRGFWITLHVPDGAKSGTYRGSVNIRANVSGKVVLASIPISVEVYPFTLSPLDKTFAIMFYPASVMRYWDQNNPNRFPGMSQDGKGNLVNNNLVLRWFKDIREHGMNAVVFQGGYQEPDADSTRVSQLQEAYANCEDISPNPPAIEDGIQVSEFSPFEYPYGGWLKEPDVLRQYELAGFSKDEPFFIDFLWPSFSPDWMKAQLKRSDYYARSQGWTGERIVRPFDEAGNAANIYPDWPQSDEELDQGIHKTWSTCDPYDPNARIMPKYVLQYTAAKNGQSKADELVRNRTAACREKGLDFEQLEDLGCIPPFDDIKVKDGDVDKGVNYYTPENIRAVFRAIREAGMAGITESNDTSLTQMGFASDGSPLIKYISGYINRISVEKRQEMMAAGGKYCPALSFEGRNKNTIIVDRELKGLWAWKTGATCYYGWVYRVGNNLNNFDSTEFGAIYFDPKKGILPTLMWEVTREAINDYRYVQTLEEMIKGVGPSTEERAWAQRAKYYLNSLKAKIPLDGVAASVDPLAPEDYETMRKTVASLIMTVPRRAQLQNPGATAPLTAHPTYCGDGIVQAIKGEQCDGRAGVGVHQKCKSDCRLQNLTYCGDGIVQKPNGEGRMEQCDLGVLLNRSPRGPCTEQCIKRK